MRNPPEPTRRYRIPPSESGVPSTRGRRRSPEDGLVALRRSLKLVTHELGHAFGMPHCVTFACNMNGSNSLEESDRYRKLRAFYRRHGLEEEASWIGARRRRR